MSTSWLLWSFALLFLIGGPILVYGFTKRIDWFALNTICTQTRGSATAFPPVSFSFLPVLADASPRSGFFALLPGLVHHRHI